jgi:hypothetical protein
MLSLRMMFAIDHNASVEPAQNKEKGNATMQPTYKVSRISPRQIDSAYLLASLAAPRLDLDGWRAFCRDALGDGVRRTGQEDIIVAANPAGYVQGLCVSAVRRHLAYGYILDVSVFVVASAADEAGVAVDLLRHVKAVARTEGCSGLHIWTRGPDNWSQHLGDEGIDRSEQGAVMILEPAPFIHV